MTTRTLEPVAPAPSTVRRRRSGLEKAKARAGWLLLAPALIHSVIFVAVPGVIVLALSFSEFRLLGSPDLVGLDNYVTLFSDSKFVQALINTVIYTLAVVPLAMALAILVALGLNQRIRFRAAYRTLFYLPVVTSTVAVATVWLWIYNPSSGLGNEVLSFLGLSRSGWLTDPGTALSALIAIGVWQGLGTKMIVYLGALQTISPELVEAARLDGASKWQIFWHVTWPGLAPAHFFVIVTSIAGSFQVFDLVYVTTQGGPVGSTNVLTYDIFQNAFGNLKLGYASAETMAMLLLVGVFIYLGRMTQRNREE